MDENLPIELLKIDELTCSSVVIYQTRLLEALCIALGVDIRILKDGLNAVS